MVTAINAKEYPEARCPLELTLPVMKEKQAVVDTKVSLSGTTILTSTVALDVCVSFFTKFHDTSGARCLSRKEYHKTHLRRQLSW